MWRKILQKLERNRGNGEILEMIEASKNKNF